MVAGARSARPADHRGAPRRDDAVVEIKRDGDLDELDLTAIEAVVSPSPARAEPHDAAAWLPLPHDLHVLPSVHALLDPHPEHQAAIVAEAEAVAADYLAVAEASSAPSPARAEPHDAATWLPLPTLEELPAVTELLEEGPPAGAPPAGAGAPSTSRPPGCSGWP